MDPPGSTILHYHPSLNIEAIQTGPSGIQTQDLLAVTAPTAAAASSRKVLFYSSESKDLKGQRFPPGSLQDPSSPRFGKRVAGCLLGSINVRTYMRQMCCWDVRCRCGGVFGKFSCHVPPPACSLPGGRGSVRVGGPNYNPAPV